MLPRVILHNGVSVDGRMDWYSGDLGLFYELAGSWPADAVLCGSGTMLAAMPPDEAATFEAQPIEPHIPAEARARVIVVDSRGRVRSWRQIRRVPYWRDPLALCSRATLAAYLEYLHENEIEALISGDDHVDLRAALEELNARYGVQMVRVDSGGTLNGALLRAGLVDEVSLLINPCLVGGETPRSIFTAPDLAAPDGVIPLKLIHCQRVRDDVLWLRYEVVKDK